MWSTQRNLPSVAMCIFFLIYDSAFSVFSYLERCLLKDLNNQALITSTITQYSPLFFSLFCTYSLSIVRILWPRFKVPQDNACAKFVREQSQNTDHIFLVNACTIYEQPVSRLAWELNSWKKEKVAADKVLGTLKENQAFFLHWFDLEWVFKGFCNSRNWGKHNLALLLRGAEKSHDKVNLRENIGFGKWNRTQGNGEQRDKCLS